MKIHLAQGRDANRNLQKAIKVQKVRDKLPAMIQHTYSLLADWYQREGQPFMYDGQDYQVGSQIVVLFEMNLYTCLTALGNRDSTNNS